MSGIQPTGGLHLGNYFGAISRWINLQNDPQKECLFSIVDLHALTQPQNPVTLRQEIIRMAATLMACGIDSSKSLLFQQSQVPQHTQLAWILSCQTTVPKLAGLPSFREKTANMKEVSLGLLSYPVLQAADILIHKANEVPVGEDNLQQLHYAQHMQQKFNNKHKTNLFPFPKPIMAENMHAARIKSLRMPDKKMSKSEPDAKGRIMILDSPDDIRLKLRKAVTDMTSQISFDPENRPGVSNLILIDHLITGTSVDDICQQNKDIQSATYKSQLAERIIEFLKPIREKAEDLMKNSDEIRRRLKVDNERAAESAEDTMSQVRQLIGIDV